MSHLPLVSIVTPSFNMAHFIRETIDSVLSQDYPHIQLIVMDGGSTDETRDILASYGDRIEWVSEKDRGQSDAVNKGFRRARGEIFTFLNADDVYLPGAVSAAVEAFQAHPEVAVVYGDAWYTDERGTPIRRYPVDPYDYQRLGSLCFICQPASFIRASAWAEVGGLNPDLHLTLDYDLWLRLAEHHPMLKIDRFLAHSRMYRDNKTLGRRAEWFREIAIITKRHRGYVPLNYLYGYAGYLLYKEDGFFEPSQPSIAKYLLTLALGVWHNPTKPHRFLAECFGSASLAYRMLRQKWTS